MAICKHCKDKPCKGEPHEIPALGHQGLVMLNRCCCDHLHCLACKTCLSATVRTCKCGRTVDFIAQR